jgi:hypothetical protein
MVQFFDSNMFTFEEQDGHLQPLHYRDLGEKNGTLYDKRVSWVDVAVNGVPLVKTYENEIPNHDESMWPKTQIVVNGRDYDYELPVEDDDYSVFHRKKWVQRLKKIAFDPVDLHGAKKKKTSKYKYPVKPKTEVKKEQSAENADKFQELVDKKDHGIIGEHSYHVALKGSNGYDGEVKDFTPPIHWLEPEFQWEKIWSAIDTIEHGYERDYHYIKQGDIEGGVKGPAIYFYDKNSDDLNFGYNPEDDFVSAEIINTSSPFDCIQRYMPYSCSLSQKSLYERAKNDYISKPDSINEMEYQCHWWWTEGRPIPSYDGPRHNIKAYDAPEPHL